MKEYNWKKKEKCSGFRVFLLFATFTTFCQSMYHLFQGYLSFQYIALFLMFFIITYLFYRV